MIMACGVPDDCSAVQRLTHEARHNHSDDS